MKKEQLKKITIKQIEKELSTLKCEKCEEKDSYCKANCCFGTPGFFAPSQSMKKLAEFLNISYKELVENYLIKDSRFGMFDSGKYLFTPICVSTKTGKIFKSQEDVMKEQLEKHKEIYERISKLNTKLWEEFTKLYYIRKINGINYKIAKWSYPLAVSGKFAKCIFLEKQGKDYRCKIYPLRPYECRAMHCKDKKYTMWFQKKYFKK